MYGAVPPVAVTVAIPPELPLHNTSVPTMIAPIAVGSAIVPLAVVVQPLASVTVTV